MMFMTATVLARTMQAAFDLAEMGLKTGEMTAAAGAVIATRLRVLAEAQQDPRKADRAELGRMVPEKIKAFSDAGAAVIDEFWSLQRDVGSYMVYVGRAMMTGRPPLPGEMLELAERSSIHGTRLATAAIGAAGVALAPIHKKATANARRLARRKRRS
jgi:hypothetical protein